MIINYEELGKPIMEIESILEQFDKEEKNLILRHINLRFNKIRQQEQIKENLNNVPLGGLIKRFMKNKDKEED